MHDKILIAKGHTATVRVQLREGYAATSPVKPTTTISAPTTARAVSALRRPPSASNK
jgi:hypothetical protein